MTIPVREAITPRGGFFVLYPNQQTADRDASDKAIHQAPYLVAVPDVSALELWQRYRSEIDLIEDRFDFHFRPLYGLRTIVARDVGAVHFVLTDPPPIVAYKSTESKCSECRMEGAGRTTKQRAPLPGSVMICVWTFGGTVRWYNRLSLLAIHYGR